MKIKSGKQRFREIQSFNRKDLHASVIESAESYLKEFPNSRGTWSNYSISLYKVDRFQDAKRALFKTIELTEENDEILCWYFCRMGHIYENSGHFHKAIEWYHKAHLANADEAAFLIYQGVMLLRIENYDEAAEVLIKATKCSDGCIDEAFYNLGVVRMAQKRYEEAGACFETALEIDPKYKIARQQLKDIKNVLEIKTQQVLE